MEGKKEGRVERWLLDNVACPHPPNLATPLPPPPSGPSHSETHTHCTTLHQGCTRSCQAPLPPGSLPGPCGLPLPCTPSNGHYHHHFPSWGCPELLVWGPCLHPPPLLSRGLVRAGEATAVVIGETLVASPLAERPSAALAPQGL